MKACNVCRLTKEPGEFHRRAASPDGVGYSCKDCARRRAQSHHTNNRVAANTARSARYRANPAHHQDVTRKWARENRGLMNAYAKACRLKREQRMPRWADFEAIAEVYVRAAFLTRILGEQFHVDHIVPLNGRDVSGLHVHTNLQILDAVENMRKQNNFSEVACPL